MPKNEKQFSLARQKRALLVIEWSTGFRPAGSVWVLLLALRGFSLVEIGFAEAVFHIVSFCCELPSGLIADVLGRKRTLAASQVTSLCSAVLMAVSGDMSGVCLSLAFSALGWNLLSGTREAVTYESMLQAGEGEMYLKFSSLQNGMFRFSNGGAMLLAGATVLLGWRKAYLLDVGICLIGLAAVLCLTEPERDIPTVDLRMLPNALREKIQEAWRLLKADSTAVQIMLVNALAGAFATLTGFFLQQRVEEAVTVPALLGPALFVLGLGGGLAGLISGKLDRMPYRKSAALTGAGVLACALLAKSTALPILMAAGLLAGLFDDGLQLVSDKKLNDRFPSAQRATLVSVSSMMFSIFMIPLAPVMGWWFT